MKNLVLILIFSGIFSGGFFNVKAQYSDNPVSLLSSYYAAINNKEYKNAYDFWQTPTDTLENFTKGYTETEKVRFIIGSPTIEGAAGSLYAQVPTVLIATMKTGKKQMFSGCYTLRKSNLHPPDIPKEDTWHIYRANLKPTSNDTEISQLLSESCAETSNMPDDNKGSRVLGVVALGDDGTDQSLVVPETIEINKDFEITVTTSGNGCVSAADTGVILGEMSADIFVYDFTSANRPGIACTMIFKTLPHKAILRFTQKGEAIIRIWGRKQGGNSPLGEPVIIVKRITVK